MSSSRQLIFEAKKWVPLSDVKIVLSSTDKSEERMQNLSRLFRNYSAKNPNNSGGVVLSQFNLVAFQRVRKKVECMRNVKEYFRI